MPGRMRFRTALAQMRGDHRPEVVHPAAHGLVRDRDPALRKQILDVTKAEREPEIEPNRLINDLWRGPISSVADFPHSLGYSGYIHPTSCRRRDKAMAGAQRRLPWRLRRRPANDEGLRAQNGRQQRPSRPRLPLPSRLVDLPPTLTKTHSFQMSFYASRSRTRDHERH